MSGATPDVARRVRAARPAGLAPVTRGGARDAFDLLAALGREDLTVARLVEADIDAREIAADHGETLDADALYGVWASGGGGVSLDAGAGGAHALTGVIRWCGGHDVVDRALVPVRREEATVLADVAARDVIASPGQWHALGCRDLPPVSGRVDAVPVRVIDGGAGYVERPGFWHGALRVAAIWVGGAEGALERFDLAWTRTDPHSTAQRAAARAEVSGARAVLETLAGRIDADPGDAAAAERRARWGRYVIERAVTRALDHLGQGAGPAPYATQKGLADHVASLHLTLRQQHALRDLQPIGEDA